MKLRYDFDASQKTYRTFPQRVVQSAGLSDRWSFLRWCCPFCLEKPRARSRASSGVPVIRITRPRSPDSDADSDEDVQWQRGNHRDAEAGVRSSRAGGWTEPCLDTASVDMDSSVGSGELDNINEEHKYPPDDDNDTDSVWSRSSIYSKESNKSKSSVTDSLKSKTSQKNKRSKDSKKKNGKDSAKSSRDSSLDKDSTKTRSPMKKIFKQLKRSTFSGSAFSAESRGEDPVALRSASRREDNRKGGGVKSPGAAQDARWRSMTMTNIDSVKRDPELHRSDIYEFRSQTLKDGAQSVQEIRRHDEEVCFSDSRNHYSEVSGGRETEEPGSANIRPGKQRAQEDNKAEVRDEKINSGSKNSVRNVDRNSISSTSPVESVKEENSLKNSGKFQAPEKAFKDKEDGVENHESGQWPAEVRSCPPETPERKRKAYESPAKQQHRRHHHQDQQRQQQQQQRQQQQGPYEEHPTPSTTPSPHHSTSPATEDETSVGGEDSGGGGGAGDTATHGGGGGGMGGGGQKSGSPSPLVGSVGRISGRDSVASLSSSTDTSCLTHPDEDIERLLQLNEKKISSLTPLGSRSESMASVCSAGAEGRYGTVIIRGEIELGLQYNYKEGQLEVHVAQCRDLAAVDTKRNRSDPYVKVYLLPDKSKSGKRKTKVKKHTLNPVFEENLKFSTTMSELESRTLWVSVWHSDMFGRNDFLGEVVITLADTVFDDISPKFYPLQDRMEPMEELSYSPRGDLILALKFVPPDAVGSKRTRRSRGALHVLVKEAKSLAAVRPHGTADPVCKGLLLPEKGKTSKQKTSVCRKTLSPTWNHTLVFDDTSLQELTERALELSVWDHDRLGPSHFLGSCRLSLGKGKHGGRPVEWMEAAGMEVKLWEQMLDRPNLWVEGAIMLRPSMDKPIYSSSMTE